MSKTIKMGTIPYRRGRTPDMKLKTILPLAAAGPLAMATALPAAPAAPGPDGAALFRQRCAGCHSVAPGAGAMVGPNLAGVVGRKAASAKFTYSPALKASKLVWNRATLDRFLTAPMKLVPGTRMVVSVSDARQRAAILDFLAKPAK